MAGFIPAIHVFRAKTWMRGTSPRMTELISETRLHAELRLARGPGILGRLRRREAYLRTEPVVEGEAAESHGQQYNDHEG